ncbi:FAD-binding oxidoreductase [Sulfoacidibacillus ferrooxidans]|uniref:D-lactate dehydrogenase (cytochrome) n=1 Tax=Sulfoacidibacillus ferrooxidans TaxID=2005001 RepID=A0A9X1V755_9BACL|nr:FAD-linked oxidase C-terminal domain-containing protein [Sulfoacidibacillus ferrooxidans]MCI0182402.1 putative FAD-linked oxidoreductase [Sulfoacidibacillus ferrooxidans]
MIATEIFDQLSALIGMDKVSVNVCVREQHGKDESYNSPSLPDLVVFPESTDDVITVVNFSAKYQIPIVPFGSGSGLEGSAIPVRGGISLDMNRMNRILEIRSEDFLVRVQSGVTKDQLNHFLKPYGLFFAVDPGANATLGGMAATNASGTTTVRYGAMRENVRAIEVVLANGTVIHTGTLAAKSSSGYNLNGLFVGSEGTLGVFTELWIKVWGIPESIVCARAEFPDITSCVEASTAVVSAGIPIVRMELVDSPYIEAFNHYRSSGFSVVPHLFLEFRGTSESVMADVRVTQELMKDEGCTHFVFVSGEKERQQMWEVRHHALYAFMHQHVGLRHMGSDVCVPISMIADAVRNAKELLCTMELQGAVLGHVGDGNFHVSLAVNVDCKEDLSRAHAFNERLVALALRVGGTCTGEHGVGLGKMKYQEKEHGTALETMRLIKSVLDPQHLLNPGKLIDPS